MARSSMGERTSASTPASARVSKTCICSLRSSSLSGPFQTISAPSSRPAASAPAWTAFQNSWVVPIGMTAIRGRFPPGPLSGPDRRQAGKARKARTKAGIRTERRAGCFEAIGGYLISTSSRSRSRGGLARKNSLVSQSVSARVPVRP